MPLYRKSTIVLLVIVAFATNMFCVNTTAATDSISISAKSAVLLCTNNQEFIYEKNPVEKLPMASTTKVLTALMALEAAEAENKTVTFTKDMIAEGSSMYLKEGNKVTLTDLAVGMLTVSGNDAANGVALTLSDSYENFAKLMNSKAQQIGMKNSNFVTPSGLNDSNHYSTAQDMAILLAYAMENEDFAQITSQKSVKVTYIEPKDYSVTYVNHNKLLSTYQYTTGGKTGFTTEAGRCLVSSAEKDGVKLVAVTLKAPNDWDDHQKLFEYGFSKLSVEKLDDEFSMNLPIVGSTEENIQISTYNAPSAVINTEEKAQIKREVSVPRFVYAPIEKGQIIGKVKYTVNGKQVAESDLISAQDYKFNKINKSITERIGEFFSSIFSNKN